MADKRLNLDVVTVNYLLGTGYNRPEITIYGPEYIREVEHLAENKNADNWYEEILVTNRPITVQVPAKIRNGKEISDRRVPIELPLTEVNVGIIAGWVASGDGEIDNTDLKKLKATDRYKALYPKKAQKAPQEEPKGEE